jgi:TolA-binding protein
MSDDLERAFRALRDEETGKSPRAEATLEKILVQRRGLRGAWARRARTWLPIAAVLVMTGSALARSGGVAWLRAQVGASDEPTETGARSGGPGHKAREGPSATVVEVASAAPVETSSAPPPEPLVVPATPPPVEAIAQLAASASHARVAQSPAPTVVSAPPPPSPPSAAPGPAEIAPPPSSAVPSEADVYARAHRLHFDGGNPRAALVAWDEYLARYPAGRFAPDARYNRAIDLLELKRTDEARIALQPFADGAFGGYHRDDARTLLKSIH